MKSYNYKDGVNYVTLFFDSIETITSKAYAAKISKTTYILPISQVEILKDTPEIVMVAIPEWLANSKGLL